MACLDSRQSGTKPDALFYFCNDSQSCGTEAEALRCCCDNRNKSVGISITMDRGSCFGDTEKVVAEILSFLS